MPRLPAILLLHFTLAVAALSQTIRWEPASGSLAKGQTTQIHLVFENCQPQGKVLLPAVSGFELQPDNTRSESSSFSRGRSTRIISYGVSVLVISEEQYIRIPSFIIKTDKGKLTVDSVDFVLSDKATPESNAIGLFAIPSMDFPQSVWLGEVFTGRCKIKVNKPGFMTFVRAPATWQDKSLINEPWSHPFLAIHGKQESIFESTLRAMSYMSGTITLNAASFELSNRAFNMPGADESNEAKAGILPGIKPHKILSEQPTVVVKPLPPGAPASFAGAVGEFKLSSEVSAASAAIGEPIVWTLILSGTGNWPQIARLPQRTVSSSFYIIEPQPLRAYVMPTDHFDAVLVEDIVLVPTKAGSYVLAPVEWAYFDPIKGSYETITTSAATITVTKTKSTSTTTQKTQQIGGSKSQRMIIEPQGAQTKSLDEMLKPTVSINQPSAPRAIQSGTNQLPANIQKRNPGIDDDNE